MPISTLLNTRWEFNNSIDFQGHSGTYQLNFETISGSFAFTSIRIDYSTQEIYYVGIGGDTLAYGYDDIEQTYAWFDSDLQQIKITSGTDVETPDVIYFITENATELPIPTYNITYHLTRLTVVGGGPSTIQEDATEELRIVVASGYESDYKVPTNITVTGCDYNYAGGYLELYNAHSDVDIWAGAEELATYTITFNLTNLTHTGANTIRENGNADCTLVANTGYILPENIQVIGALFNYSKVTGNVALSMATGNVTITARGGANPSSLGITFYRNSSDDIRVDKSEYLTQVAFYTGTLREETSITNPVITIATDVFQPCNYAYIGDFGRWYYIDDIISVRKGLWEVSLTCDVLMTYRVGIKNLKLLASRNEFEQTINITDDRALHYNDKEYERIVSGSSQYVTNPFDFSFGSTKVQYVITALTKEHGFPIDLLPTPDKTPISLDSNKHTLLTTGQFYQITHDIADPDFANALKNMFSNNPMEAVISMRCYPLDLARIFKDSGTTGTVNFGIANWSPDPDVSVMKWQAKTLTPQTVRIARFSRTPTKQSDYLAAYYLYIPCYGFVEIPYEYFINTQMDVMMTVDLNTGMAMIRLLVGEPAPVLSDDKEVQRFTFPIAVDIPVTQSNAAEIARNIFTGAITSAVTIASAFIAPQIAPAMLGTAGVTKMKVADGVIRTGKRGRPRIKKRPITYGEFAQAESVEDTIHRSPIVAHEFASMASQAVEHYDRGTGGGISQLSWDSYTSPFILKSSYKYFYPENYNHTQGRPLYEYRTVSTLSGYTEFINVHIEGDDFNNAIGNEVEIIEKQLESGVIL